jgi:hypothetical protein
MSFFIEIEKNPKIHMEAQKTQIAKAILSQRSSAGFVTMHGFKLHYRAAVTKSAWS